VVPEVLLPPLVLPDPVPLLLPLVPAGRAALEGLLLLVILFLPLPLVALAVLLRRDCSGRVLITSLNC
jgi:hypothetical protein